MPATNELLQEGRYRISQSNPRNGDALLFDAYDTVNETNVVVKEIPIKLNKVTTASQQESLASAFVAQAESLAKIDHPSLLHVRDYFSEIGRQFLVMESVEGDTLKDLLDRNKSAFPISDVMAWADELLDALNYLHSQNPAIYHGNIRPENILLTSDGRIKLQAFGMPADDDARATGLVAEPSADRNLRYSPLEQIWPGLDPASQKVITNSYDERSERILKDPVDARSDIYSLGATLYHLLTAREPVDALERSIEILDGKNDPLREPAKLDARIAPEISDVLMKAIEVKRENRYDSAIIMRQVLKTALVRVAEREEAEARELEEAAADLRLAQETRHDQVKKLVEEKRREIEAEQKKENELLQQKLREAEEQRLQAEQRAAEIERLLAEKAETEARLAEEAERLRIEKEKQAEKLRAEKEQAAEKARADAAAKAEANARAEAARLEAARKAEEAARAEAEAAAIAEAAAKAKAEAAALEQEAREAELAAAAVAAPAEDLLELPEDPVAQISEAPDAVLAEEPVFDELPAPLVKEADEPDASPFSYGEEPAKRSSLPLPLIGVVAAVLIIAGVAGWILFASEQPKPAPAAPAQAVVPAAEQPLANQAASQVPPAQSETAQPAVPAASESSQEEASAAASERPEERNAAEPQAKPKKPASQPAKPQVEKKKAVTVDDLINDN